MSEDNEIKPRTVATFALIARHSNPRIRECSNHSARSHLGYSVENPRDRLCVNAPNVVSSRQVSLVSSTLKEGVNKSFHLLQYETKMHSSNQSLNLTKQDFHLLYKKFKLCSMHCCYTGKINYRRTDFSNTNIVE